MAVEVRIVGDKELIAKFDALPDKVRDRLTRAVTEQGFALQRYVQEGKLSGQVLHVRSGVLRTSINLQVRQLSQSVEGSVGTNVVYAAVHEYGFDGDVTVRPYTRQVTQVFGNPWSGTAEVREHIRHMHMPERSFLRSALADMTQEIGEALAAAVQGAIEE